MRLTTIYLPFLVELGLGVALGLWMADAVILEATPTPQCFFFPREPRKSAREQFRKSAREHLKLPVNPKKRP